MDELLRKAEREWVQEPTLQNWIRLLRISEIAGQSRFTREALVTALGPFDSHWEAGEVIKWETSPTGFKAKIRNGIYPHRKHVRDLSSSSGYPRYEVHEDYEIVRDKTNWDGWLEVAWCDSDDPELQIQVYESWEFGIERYGDKIIPREYRYIGGPVTNDEELNAALVDYENWESMD